MPIYNQVPFILYIEVLCIINSYCNIIQLMTFDEVDIGIYKPKKLTSLCFWLCARYTNVDSGYKTL